MDRVSESSETEQPSSKVLAKRAALITMLAAEVDRQLESVGERTRSMATRASILIGSASIMTGLQLPNDNRPWQYVVSLAAGAIAAILGVLVLIPRHGTEVTIEEAEQTFWNLSESQGRRALMHWKLGTLKEQERALKSQAILIVIGFAALAASLVFAALALSA